MKIQRRLQAIALMLLTLGIYVATQDTVSAGTTNTLGNHDVHNTCSAPANGFALFLEGIAPADVTEVYDGSNNIFGYPGGIVDISEPGTTVITWLPTSPATLVQPGDISHFGYTLAEGKEQNLTDERFMWLFNQSELCQTPGLVQGWGPADDNIDLSNPHPFSLDVLRLHATSTTSLDLADLLPGTSIVQSAVDVLGSPGGTTTITSGNSTDFDFPTDENAVDRLLVTHVFDSNGNPQVTSYYARPTKE